MSEQEVKSELEPETTGDLFVVGRTSPHGGYNGYASLPIKRIDDQSVIVDRDADCTDVHFFPVVTNAYVTWFRAEQRRDVLQLFARFPKSFERCELVSLKRLRADHFGVPRYAQMVERGVRIATPPEPIKIVDFASGFDVPTPDGKRTYLRIRVGDTVFISPRSSVQIEEVTLTEQEFRSIVDR
jgi:hypothetical protein